MIRGTSRSIGRSRSGFTGLHYQIPKAFLSTSRIANATEGSLKSFIPKPSKSLGETTIENNIKSDTNRLSKTLTKFWEKVDAVYNKDLDKYEVKLDGKTLKTPLGFPLSLPNEKKQLAYLVAHEWANLPDLKVKINALPLTSLSSRAIDLYNVYNNENVDREMISKVGNVDDIKVNLLRYLDTDTCLIFTTLDEYEGKLRNRQNELYFPLIKEFEDYFTEYAKRKGNLLKSEDERVSLKYLDCETYGLSGNRQSITTQNIVMSWMNDLSMYELVALERAILTAKSFLCGAALLRSNCSNESRMKDLYQINKSSATDYYHKTVEELVELGNLEIIFQTEEWGEVEDTHDVDKVDWLRHLSSCALLTF